MQPISLSEAHARPMNVLSTDRVPTTGVYLLTECSAVVGGYASPANAIRSADCSCYLEAVDTRQMPYYASACSPTGTVTKRYASACACSTEIALPTPARSCLNGPEATDIINAFASLLTGPQASTFNVTANALLASDFTDTSDSIDYLAGFPVARPTDHEGFN